MSSVIETLQFGPCLVVLPFIIDQPSNPRLLEDQGLTVEIGRKEDGSFSGDDIAKCKAIPIMVFKEGEELRKHTREAATVFGDNKLLQDNYVGCFLEYLRNGVTN